MLLFLYKFVWKKEQQFFGVKKTNSAIVISEDVNKLWSKFCALKTSDCISVPNLNAIYFLYENLRFGINQIFYTNIQKKHLTLAQTRDV